ncbi:MAG: rRNA pseudouridine synthase [Chloroflexi bacterium]|nr:MAG: rRNA pseudouridine synthase [Chloroflexota bacterium]
MPLERLQKLLAGAGYGSRRSSEVIIADGRVTIDGRVATLGERADPLTQRVEVDGEPLMMAEAAVWMLHKPAGYLVSKYDPHGEHLIYELLQSAPQGLRYVGRLDLDSEGLLLLTTDGELAHRLAHPRYEVWKTYVAELRREPSREALEALRGGVELEDGMTAPTRVELEAPAPYARARISLREGRKREVRRMFAAVGCPVTRLVRVDVGGVSLGDLPEGAARPLTVAEEQHLRVLVGLVDATDSASL